MRIEALLISHLSCIVTGQRGFGTTAGFYDWDFVSGTPFPFLDTTPLDFMDTTAGFFVFTTQSTLGK